MAVILNVLLPLADGWGCQGYADYGGVRQRCSKGLVEGTHVLWQEALANGSQGFYPLLLVGHECCLSYGSGRLVFEGKASVKRPYFRAA
jgi:hypothetical protein